MCLRISRSVLFQAVDIGTTWEDSTEEYLMSISFPTNYSEECLAKVLSSRLGICYMRYFTGEDLENIKINRCDLSIYKTLIRFMIPK